MPTRKRAATSARLPDVELDLPAPIALARHAPELERPDLGQVRVQAYRHRRARVALGVERDLERGDLLHLARLPTLDHRPRPILAADGGAEEAELGGDADDETELHPR